MSNLSTTGSPTEYPPRHRGLRRGRLGEPLGHRPPATRNRSGRAPGAPATAVWRRITATRPRAVAFRTVERPGRYARPLTGFPPCETRQRPKVTTRTDSVMACPRNRSAQRSSATARVAGCSTGRCSGPILTTRSRRSSRATKIVAARPRLASQTGQATALRPASRSSIASAKPWARTRSISTARAAGSVIVRGVNDASLPRGSATSPNASLTLPADDAWPTLGLAHRTCATHRRPGGRDSREPRR